MTPPPFRLGLRLALRRLVFVLAALAAAGCATTPKSGSGGGQLTLNPPEGKPDSKRVVNWTPIPKPNGQHYVHAREGMNDVIAMYAVESEPDQTLKTIDDVAARLKGDPRLKFESFKRSQELGVPVLRFERIQEDKSNGDQEVQAALKTYARTENPPFYVRTIGAVMLHPNKPNRYVTVACSRSSTHGEIGNYYTDLYADFLARFVADNMLRY